MPVLFEEILFDLELQARRRPRSRRDRPLARPSSRTVSPSFASRSTAPRPTRMPDRRPELTRSAALDDARAGRGGDDGDRPGPVGHRLARSPSGSPERLARGAADGLLELTPYDLSVLVETALIELREFDSRRRSSSAGPRRSGARPLDDRRGPAPHPPLGPGRRVERRKDRASPSARRSSPAARTPRRPSRSRRA